MEHKFNWQLLEVDTSKYRAIFGRQDERVIVTMVTSGARSDWRVDYQQNGMQTTFYEERVTKKFAKAALAAISTKQDEESRAAKEARDVARSRLSTGKVEI